MQKKVRVTIVVAAVVALLASTAAFAYLTHYRSSKTTFSAGNVEGELLGTPVATASGAIQPGQTIITAPYVKNKGNGDAIVFVEMEIPVENVKVFDGTNVSSASERPLFEPGDINSDYWAEYISPTVANGVQKTVFVYTNVVRGGTEAVTEPIFTNMDVINTTSMAKTSYDVSFKAKLIQAEGIGVGELDQTEQKAAYDALTDQGE